MTHTLGLAGRKQSGKNTALNWLIGNQLIAVGEIDNMQITADGKLMVPALVEGQVKWGILDVDNPDAAPYLSSTVWPFIKQYSFATPLKQFCINVLGLSYTQCYGSDEDKNSFTNIMWEDVPNKPKGRKLYGEYVGAMTAREVLQHFGTNICRKMRNNCWVEATIRQIQKDAPQLAVITDVRFPNEVEGVQAVGGKVIRFTRAPFAEKDTHDSEIALDNHDGFDYTIDNKGMSIPQQNEALTKLLKEWNYLPWTFEEK